MDRFTDGRDDRLLEQDKYTFFVLRRVLGGECELVLTDHKRLLLCYTCAPYPVWLWTPEDATPAELENAYRLTAENGFLRGGQRLILKDSAAAYFMKRAAADGRPLTVAMRMCAYECPAPIAPTVVADGCPRLCGPADTEELAEIMDRMRRETGTDIKDRDGCRRDAEAAIEAGQTYFWTNARGQIVSSCKYGPNGELASVNLVYTYPEFRRRHYAQNLVYAVTRIVREAGYTPILYTNADYAASNACYRQIGYELRGQLTTLACADK